MVGAAGAGAGAELGTGVGAGVGAWSQAGADADSMTGADSDAASGLAMESVGSTEMDVSSVPVLASARGVSSASTFGLASTGVDTMVVMPALAFSGS